MHYILSSNRQADPLPASSRHKCNARIRATVRSEASFGTMSYGQKVTRQKNVPTFQAVQMTFGHDNSRPDTSFQVGSQPASHKLLYHLLYLWAVVLVVGAIK